LPKACYRLHASPGGIVQYIAIDYRLDSQGMCTSHGSWSKVDSLRKSLCTDQQDSQSTYKDGTRTNASRCSSHLSLPQVVAVATSTAAMPTKWPASLMGIRQESIRAVRNRHLITG
jgi:hypothetical protein